MSYSTHQIRNVALAGHPGAGKTTLFEALLHAGGALQAAGTIERGNTVSDFDPIERERGHSIDAAIASTDHGGIHVNLIDTPGYPDFRGPALSALAAVETVAIVVDADTGVGHGSRRMMEYAKQRGLCRAIVVNKIDHAGHDLGALMEALRAEFGAEALPHVSFRDGRVAGLPARVSRVSFTGEVSYEVAVPWSQAEPLRQPPARRRHCPTGTADRPGP